MNFSRAKTYLIFMFLAVDLFLVYILLSNTSSLFSKNESIEKVYSLLEKNMIYLENKDTIPNNENLYNITLENASSNKQSFAEDILGKYTSEDENTFSSDKGQIIFSSGEIIFTPAGKNEFKNDLSSEETAKEILTLISSFGIETKNLVWENTKKEKNGLFKAVFKYNIYDKKLLNSEFTVLFKKEGIEKISGGVYKVSEVKNENLKLKTTEEILIRFSSLNKNNKKVYISKMESGYFNPKKNYSTFSAVPVMKITLKTGEFFYFDLSNAELLENV